jgi:hypothetical protein
MTSKSNQKPTESDERKWHGQKVWCPHVEFETKECEMGYQYFATDERMPDNACQLCAQLSLAQAIGKLAAAIRQRGDDPTTTK